MIKERLKALRRKMQENGVDIYVVPTADFHESEYVGEYFKARRYITGFTGSAGVAVITMDDAGLWTDGRYWIQAEHQLEGSGVRLFKAGSEGVMSIEQYIESNLKEGGVLGFDGRVVNDRMGRGFEKIASAKNASLKIDKDLIDEIWSDRPSMGCKEAFVLSEKYSGRTVGEKLAQLRAEMADKGADVHVLTTLDDIAWLLNVRGGDVDGFPVVLSYVIVTKDSCTWFVNDVALTPAVKKHIDDSNVIVKGYDEIYDALAQIDRSAKVMLDCRKVNFRIANMFDRANVIDCVNPAILMKAIKNPVELENTRNAHIKDGVAFTKFMYWLKNNIGKTEITEISASDYIYECRKAQDGFIQPSFTTISAYGPNAAMMHYSATEETNATLKPEGFLLVDSGGHYMEGSTDITRTIALGELSHIQKLHFTAVARSNLNLAAARFLYGCNGQNLDILARGPIWDLGIDYKCGTGHGMGYILNIHEPPNGFRWQIVPERSDSAKFEEGMVTTDEPGIYLEGQYGIRTENELICHKGEKNEHGQFMYFETITFAPIDLDAILPEEMSKTERERLNNYHKMVYEKLSPYMTAEENAWLKHYTREI